METALKVEQDQLAPLCFVRNFILNVIYKVYFISGYH